MVESDASEGRAAPPSRRRRWRNPRFLLPLAALVVVVLAVAILAVAGWIFSSAVRDEALSSERDPDEPEIVVDSVQDGLITLRPLEGSDSDTWRTEGRYGLEWDGGWGFVGAIRELDGDRVVREFDGSRDTPAVGVEARLDGFAFPQDPFVAHGIPFEGVVIEGELGPMPAWYVPAEGDIWVVFTHGRRASRREALRMLPAVHALGLPALVITYRNDPEAPGTDDGYLRYGETEWPDLEGAVAYALESGARQVVLVGYSMGGAISLSFMEKSPLAGEVAALVLDAPLMSLESAVEFEADDRGIPGFVTWVAKRMTSWRFDVDWGDIEYRDTARSLQVPVLLFHGEADDLVPIADSEELAAARPDIVSFVPVAGAGHVRSWNLDPEGYEQAVTAFLLKVIQASQATAQWQAAPPQATAPSAPLVVLGSAARP